MLLRLKKHYFETTLDRQEFPNYMDIILSVSRCLVMRASGYLLYIEKRKSLLGLNQEAGVH